MRTLLVVSLALSAAAAPAAAQQHQHGGAAQPAQGSGHAGHAAGGHSHGMPEGWTVRLDRANAPMNQVMFMEMAGGLHAVLGPAGIFYNPAHTASGNFTVSGSFTQNKLSAHPEGYGLMVGGRNLEAPNLDYLYFLVRQDGKFLIKHRAGEETHMLVDWTEHAAIAKPDAQGRATNVLAVESTPAGVRFLVNGQEVSKLQGPNTAGVQGLRLNHNIDVLVRDFGITAAAN